MNKTEYNVKIKKLEKLLKNVKKVKNNHVMDRV